MVAQPRRQRLNLPLAPWVAGSVAGLVALSFALLPSSLLEDAVRDSGIVAFIGQAEPPLGFKARAILILVGGGGAGLVTWLGLFLMLGTRSIAISGIGADDEDGLPLRRRADAHPDAPPRRPLLANRDLGTPFLEVRAPIHAPADAPRAVPEAETGQARAPMLRPGFVLPPEERALPLDLERPLSAYDPSAIPAEPIDWFPPPARLMPGAPRPKALASDEPFELTPMVRQMFPPVPVETVAPVEIAPPPLPPPVRRPEEDASASIHALLHRLEQRVGRPAAVPVQFAPPPPKESLNDVLASLRRLANSHG